jgi:putative addiction module component (TIGR02574 family)
MNLTFQELRDASANLPPPQRAELAHFLLRSLEPQEEGWTEAWHEELTRRMAEIRSGEVKGIPADEVLRGLRERYP